jgi:hypothetical protein
VRECLYFGERNRLSSLVLRVHRIRLWECSPPCPLKPGPETRQFETFKTPEQRAPPFDCLTMYKAPSPSMTSTGKERWHLTLRKYLLIKRRLAVVVEFWGCLVRQAIRRGRKCFRFQVSGHLMDGELHHAMHPSRFSATLSWR